MSPFSFFCGVLMSYIKFGFKAPTLLRLLTYFKKSSKITPSSQFSWPPRGGSSAIYGREAGVALTGMKKQRRDRGW